MASSKASSAPASSADVASSPTSPSFLAVLPSQLLVLFSTIFSSSFAESLSPASASNTSAAATALSASSFPPFLLLPSSSWLASMTASAVAWICSGFRFLAILCVGPFLFLVLLDLIGYLIARTLHITPQRVRVRAASNASAPTERVATSTGTTTAALLSEAGERDLVATSSSGDEGFALDRLVPSKPQAIRRRSSHMKHLSISPISTSDQQQPLSFGAAYASSTSTSATNSSSVSTASSTPPSPTNSLHQFIMTTPGERHAALPAVRPSSRSHVRSDSVSSVASSESGGAVMAATRASPSSMSAIISGAASSLIPSSGEPSPKQSGHSSDLSELSTKRRARSASVGVEGPLGLSEEEGEDDDDDDDEYDEEDVGALGLRRRVRRGTIRPVS